MGTRDVDRFDDAAGEMPERWPLEALRKEDNGSGSVEMRLRVN